MKAGFVSLVGLPNAGKSTFVNALIGEKVGIVSAKPQTTRKRVIGIYNEPDLQACFVDSPGYVEATTGLNAYLKDELKAVIKDGDLLIAVLNLDARKLEDLLALAEMAANSGKKWFAVITKMDIDKDLRSERLRTELLKYNVPVLNVSAVKRPERLRELILPLVREMLPENPAPFFDNESYTTQNIRDLVAEIVREKCFEALHQEVPYGLAVKVLKYDETGKLPKIYTEIMVSKESFVPMVLGAQGRRIKHIGIEARKECEKILGQKIYLETHVKLKKDWTKNAQVMKELGYVINE
jgi:GTP-binding protein Era